MDSIKEGSLYKSIEIEGTVFNIYYGYYSKSERERWEPAPIFPDFIKAPTYTSDGKPHTRADQDVCEHYEPKPNISGENWCNDCKHFVLWEEILGICHCDDRKCIFRQNE